MGMDAPPTVWWNADPPMRIALERAHQADEVEHGQEPQRGEGAPVRGFVAERFFFWSVRAAPREARGDEAEGHVRGAQERGHLANLGGDEGVVDDLLRAQEVVRPGGEEQAHGNGEAVRGRGGRLGRHVERAGRTRAGLVGAARGEVAAPSA